jgi:hypothetical protein
MELLQVTSDSGIVLTVIGDDSEAVTVFKYPQEWIVHLPQALVSDFRATMSQHLSSEELWTMLTLWCLDVAQRDS